MNKTRTCKCCGQHFEILPGFEQDNCCWRCQTGEDLKTLAEDRKETDL
jgi:hypothetical protein